MQFSTFSFAQQYNIRAFEKDGIAWFVAADICKALEIQNPTQAIEKLDDDERSMFNIGRSETHGGGGEVNIINESGLFILILRSRKAMEKGTPQHTFRKWVTAEVLPAIRKTGSYSTPAARRTLNEWEQHQIQVAVKQRSARTGETTQGIYVRLHNFMCVTRYEQIKQADFQAALNFLASIQDAPELFRQPEIQGIVLTEEEIATIAVLTQYAQRMNLFCEDLAPRLRAIQSPMAAEAYSWREMPRGWICKSQRALMRAFPHMQQTQHIDTVRVAFSKMS